MKTQPVREDDMTRKPEDYTGKDYEAILQLADCGEREGLSPAQEKRLAEHRMALAQAIVGQGLTVDRAKGKLGQFYATCSSIKNDDMFLTAEQAVANDFRQLSRGIAEFDPDLAALGPRPR
jgi:DNA-nicking Smr family endonuclease